MKLSSSGIQANGQLLAKYTIDGENVNPPLTFSETPPDGQSLTLIMEDVDAPGGIFTHWLLYDMSPAMLEVMENAMPLTGKVGKNDFGTVGYRGPAPPSGTHRYYLRLYALDTLLQLPEGAERKDLLAAMEGHVKATAEIMGTYSRTAS